MDYLKQAVQILFSGDRELWQIIATTLVMSLFSTAVSSAIGIPTGVLLGKRNFRGKGVLMRILNTLMGLPPVVAGLVVFMLFRSVGPFGSLKLMFSVPVMVIAQVVLITPVVCSLCASQVGEIAVTLCETAKGIGIPGTKQTALIIMECFPQFIGIILMAFGRSIAEVGAVSLVGGNIQFKTRVMTTAILLEANKGNFEKALALGIILMLISLVVNIAGYSVREAVSD